LSDDGILGEIFKIFDEFVIRLSFCNALSSFTLTGTTAVRLFPL
jgi:hypothetical protein